jgi:hypothetical protein
MANSLMDHLWSMGELLWPKVPPKPYVAPPKKANFQLNRLLVVIPITGSFNLMLI